MVPWLLNSFAKDSSTREHEIRAFSFFFFRGLPEEENFAKYSVFSSET